MIVGASAIVDDVIASRRTVKEFAPEPVPRDVIEQLLRLATFAPNHRLTQPWRFRVLGDEARERLKVAAGAGAEKLDRAPTLIVVSVVPSPLPLHAEEDMLAGACAMYAVMLAAQARGIASYWRTPGVLRSDEGLRAVGITPAEERILGLLHLGRAAGDMPAAPVRDPGSTIFFLD